MAVSYSELDLNIGSFILEYCCVCKYNQCFSCPELDKAENKLVIELKFCCLFLDEAEGVHPGQTEAWTDRSPSVGSVSG